MNAGLIAGGAALTAVGLGAGVATGYQFGKEGAADEASGHDPDAHNAALLFGGMGTMFLTAPAMVIGVGMLASGVLPQTGSKAVGIAALAVTGAALLGGTLGSIMLGFKLAE